MRPGVQVCHAVVVMTHRQGLTQRRCVRPLLVWHTWEFDVGVRRFVISSLYDVFCLVVSHLFGQEKCSNFGPVYIEWTAILRWKPRSSNSHLDPDTGYRDRRPCVVFWTNLEFQIPNLIQILFHYFAEMNNTIPVHFITIYYHQHNYRVSQEECARLREGVPYVTV